MFDDLPPLPMHMPEMAPPTSHTFPKRPVTAKAVQSDVTPALPQMVTVDATDLTIDDRFGLDTDALAIRYAGAIAEARARLTNATAQTLYPSVLRSGHGRFVAYTGIPIVIAAIETARVSNATVMVTVVVHDAIDGEALLRDIFEKARPRSLFEKARYIAGCEAKYGNRRAWMHAEGINAPKWEPRFSKIAKLSKLDKRLLDAIDPHTISNAEVAGRIVDACSDPVKRRVVIDMVRAAAAATTGPLNAGPLFKRIDAAFNPTPPPFAVSDWADGARDLLGPEGAVIATLTRDSDGWSITGVDLAVMTRNLLGSALDALKT